MSTIIRSYCQCANIELVTSTYGGINVLVNNAGYFESGLFEQLTYVLDDLLYPKEES